MPKIRNIIIFVAIFIVIILVYMYFFKPAPETPSLVSSTPTPAAGTDVTSLPNAEDATVANDFLTLLLSVKNIKLEDAIFSDEAFKSLHDSSIELIQDGTEGRPNPFAPIGSDSTPAAPSSTTTTSPTTSTTTDSSSTINTPPAAGSTGASGNSVTPSLPKKN